MLSAILNSHQYTDFSPNYLLTLVFLLESLVQLKRNFPECSILSEDIINSNRSNMMLKTYNTRIFTTRYTPYKGISQDVYCQHCTFSNCKGLNQWKAMSLTIGEQNLPFGSVRKPCSKSSKLHSDKCGLSSLCFRTPLFWEII